jgi:hypothetical protein
MIWKLLKILVVFFIVLMVIGKLLSFMIPLDTPYVGQWLSAAATLITMENFTNIFNSIGGFIANTRNTAATVATAAKDVNTWIGLIVIGLVLFLILGWGSFKSWFSGTPQRLKDNSQLALILVVVGGLIIVGWRLGTSVYVPLVVVGVIALILVFGRMFFGNAISIVQNIVEGALKILVVLILIAFGSVAILAGAKIPLADIAARNFPEIQQNVVGSILNFAQDFGAQMGLQTSLFGLLVILLIAGGIYYKSNHGEGA